MENLLDRFLSFYVFSNIHVAVSTSCLVLLTLDHYGLGANWTVPFVFCSTVLAYNFIREIEQGGLYPLLTNWAKSSPRSMLLLNALMAAGLIYAASRIGWKDLLFIVPFFLLTLLYVLPGNRAFRGFRNLPGFKLFIIALVWAGVTVLFPVWFSDEARGSEFWTLFAQRFLLVMAITIPFDIRDMQLDNMELATLPQTLGIGRSKITALVGVSIFALLFFAGDHFDRAERSIGVIVASVSAILVLGAGVYQRKYYSSFWVEGIPVLWWLLTLWFR